ncbi:MAG: sugar ABC transporter permease [Lentisphaerota bacterium]
MKKYTNTSMTAKKTLKGWGFSSVYIIFSLLFFVYPVVWMLILMFSKWNFIGEPKWNGFHNIVRVLTDGLFWQSILNVFRFMVMYIPLVFISSVLFALGLKKLKYGKTFVALSFFVAQAAPGVAYSIIFSKIFSQDGPMNAFLYEHFGFVIPWFDSPTFAMLSIALIVTWKFVGYYGIILYSGMNAIPQSIYEAADIDGANGVKCFFKITLPLLNSQMVMIMVLAITLAFGVFTEAFLITGGGPLNSTMTPLLVMYNSAFRKLDPTFSATMAVAIAIISYLVIIITRKLIEKEVDLV